MADENDLFKVIKETLHKEGHLSKLQVEMGVRIMEILNSNIPNTGELPKMPEDVLILNELIREYLEWTGYLYSTSVLVAESGMSPEKMPRQKLAASLGVEDDENTSTIPLLLSIVSTYRERLRKHNAKNKKP